MSQAPHLLSSAQMARFVARGFLRFDAVVPDDINAQFMAEAGEVAEPKPGERLMKTYGQALAANAIPEVSAGTPLSQTYPEGSAISRLLDLPLVRGALQSLLGDDPVFDHHFLHITHSCTPRHALHRILNLHTVGCSLSDSTVHSECL